ncbi:MAG: lysine 2,3-aminomutase, partial [Bradyrhizobium sp.]|nr:lysine 2,3-aminomutase [Bradyrhizobium sp.]
MAGKSLKLYGLQHLDILRRYRDIPDRALHDMRVVGQVLPFRVNNYVLDELIDWAEPDEDPFYRLTMLDRHMLDS